MTASSVAEPPAGETDSTAGDMPAEAPEGRTAATAAEAGPDVQAGPDAQASSSEESGPDGEPGAPGAAAEAGVAGDDDDEGGESVEDEELFQQSEIAADYVEGLLDVLDMDGDIDELVASGRPVVEVVGGRLQSLVGQRGATLEALQDLTRLAVFRRTGTPSRLLLDIGGYRATRRNELAAVARNAVERVKEHGEPIRLEAMSAFERKCVHDVINVTDGVVSESHGEEPNRRILVRPE